MTAQLTNILQIQGFLDYKAVFPKMWVQKCIPSNSKIVFYHSSYLSYLLFLFLLDAFLTDLMYFSKHNTTPKKTNKTKKHGRNSEQFWQMTKVHKTLNNRKGEREKQGVNTTPIQNDSFIHVPWKHEKPFMRWLDVCLVMPATSKGTRIQVKLLLWRCPDFSPFFTFLFGSWGWC